MQSDLIISDTLAMVCQGSEGHAEESHGQKHSASDQEGAFLKQTISITCCRQHHRDL